MARHGSGHGKLPLHRGDTTTLVRLRIPPVVDRDPRTVREPTTATVSASMTENGIETRAEIVRGRARHLLVARVDVKNTMAMPRIREVDGTTGGREIERRDMSIGREIRGMERERTPLTDNKRRDTGLGHRQRISSTKAEAEA
jgi:hypothetical protein